jgi:hypothetical protein
VAGDDSGGDEWVMFAVSRLLALLVLWFLLLGPAIRRSIEHAQLALRHVREGRGIIGGFVSRGRRS